MDSLFKEYKGVFEEKLEVIEKKKATFEYSYSPFALQDALGAKDTKAVWIEYIKLRSVGVEAESILFNLVSKIRDILGIFLGASQSDLGIKKYFSYNKSRKDTKNWKKEEIERLYSRLITVYHESRMGGEDLDSILEKELLKL